MSVFAYPGLSDIGRVRIDSKAAVKYQLIKSLYLNVSLYLNYDSKPPRPTSKRDYGASSSIGWTFSNIQKAHIGVNLRLCEAMLHVSRRCLLQPERVTILGNVVEPP
jgi:hypothetical protein